MSAILVFGAPDRRQVREQGLGACVPQDVSCCRHLWPCRQADTILARAAPLDACGPAGSRRNRHRPDLTDGPIIVFDAVCVLCCANAQFVLRHDRAGVFRFASMQGEVGAELYRSFGIDPQNPDTLIVVDSGQVLRDSDAVLAIYGGLGWPWRAALLFKLVPRRLRDPLYRWVARNRYRIFGRRESCWMPEPEHADRIL